MITKKFDYKGQMINYFNKVRKNPNISACYCSFLCSWMLCSRVLLQRKIIFQQKKSNKMLDTQRHSCYNKYIKNKENNTKRG